MTERNYKTREIPQEQQPEVIPDYVPKSIENDGHGWPLWLKRTVGGVAAVSALVVGGVVGVEASSHHGSEAPRPVATAPVTPGETASATPSPTNTAEKNIDSSVFTPENFTFTGPDGKEYKGAQAFEQSLAIPVPAEVPTTDEYNNSVVMEVLSRLHYCATAPASPETLAKYGTNHTPETLNLYHDACMAALTSTPISALEDNYTSDSEGYMRASTQVGDKAKLTYEVTSLSALPTSTAGNSVIGAWVQETVTRTDPRDPSAPFTEKRVLAMGLSSEGGTWKITNYGPDNGAFTGPAPANNTIG